MWLAVSQYASGDVSHWQLGGYVQFVAGGTASKPKWRGLHWVAMRPHMGLAVSQSVSMLPTADGITHNGITHNPPITGRGVSQFKWRGYQLGDYAPI